MAYDFIVTKREGSVEYLTLNRPDVRNAFNEQLIGEIAAWAAQTAADTAIRAVVLAGEGPVFCAGADARWMAKTIDATEEQNLQDAMAAARMFAALDALPMPVVGRVHGAAFGGGAGLAAVCDIAIAEDATQFGFTEVKLGIIPAVISPFVLAKIGRGAARELFLTGERFSAARARDIGLVQMVVPVGGLDQAVAGCLRELLSGSPAAIAAAKALIRDVWGRPLAEATPLTAAAIARQRTSAEGQEGLRAFLEKRRPGWSR